jgi:Helix-turn-helix domain
MHEKFSYTVKQVEELTGFDDNRIYQMIDSGLLVSFKHGKRRFVTRRALEECLQRLEEMTNRQVAA